MDEAQVPTPDSGPTIRVGTQRGTACKMRAMASTVACHPNGYDLLRADQLTGELHKNADPVPDYLRFFPGDSWLAGDPKLPAYKNFRGTIRANAGCVVLDVGWLRRELLALDAGAVIAGQAEHEYFPCPACSAKGCDIKAKRGGRPPCKTPPHGVPCTYYSMRAPPVCAACCAHVNHM